MKQASLELPGIRKRKMRTQSERLLEQLMNGQIINPLYSWAELGIYRLASRICDLRQGKVNNIPYDIKGEMREVQNRFGEYCRVKFYWIESEDRIRYRIEARR